MQVKCSNCSKNMERFQCLVARNKTGLWFCSYDCQKEYRKQNAKAPTLTCSVCQKEFTVKPYRLNKKQKSITCSRECKTSALGWGKKTVGCDWCGKSMTRRNSFISERNFCNRTCMGNWQSVNILGESSPSWRGGWPGYYGKDWAAMNRAAKKRDNHTCQGCEKPQSDLDHTLEVHHLRPVRLFKKPNDANRLDNLITLCRDCHITSDVFARLLFDEHRFDAKAFHSLKDHVAIRGAYLNHPTLSAKVVARDHCCSHPSKQIDNYIASIC